MPRIPYADPQELAPAEREALEAAPPLNIFRMLAHAGPVFRSYVRFGGAILVRTKLDPRLRELAILHVARVAEAEYEWTQHVGIAAAAGADDAMVEAIAAGQIDDAARLDAPSRAVLAFTAAVLDGPRVDDATFATLQAHLSPPEIVELLLTIGNYLMLARVMTVLELELDPPMGEAVVAASRPNC